MTYSKGKFFSLLVRPGDNEVKISMQLFSPYINTKEIPDTYNLLAKHLPSVLKNECFNDNNYRFEEEVRQTEIGHLFEHLILEYLCQAKINCGSRNASFSGRTSWDTETIIKGIFNINIKINHRDLILIDKAIIKASALLDIIFASNLHQATDSGYTIRSQKTYFKDFI